LAPNGLQSFGLGIEVDPWACHPHSDGPISDVVGLGRIEGAQNVQGLVRCLRQLQNVLRVH
jgi:hypothetical protein